MPLYEYLCRDCNQQVELLVRNESESPRCPKCDSGRLMKLLSVPAAPATSNGPGQGDEPSGPCGSSCGCFPQG